MSEDDKNFAGAEDAGASPMHAQYILRMMDRHPGLAPRRTRVSGRLLWIFATALGGATIVSAGTMLHDTSRRRDAARLVARATAEQIVSLATERLSIATLSREAEESLRFDLATRRLDVSPALNGRGAQRPSPDLLTELAANAAAHSRDPRVGVHLATDTRLGNHVLVTETGFDSAGAPMVVSGLVADARVAGRAIFGQLLSGPPVDSARGLVRLDSLSLEVRTADGRVLFGAIGNDPGRDFHATVHPVGPLDGLSVAVGITARQIPRGLLSFAPQMELWHLGMLFFCTTLVIGAAASSSRRALALARARSDFIAGVSHELRMPLAQILLAGETLTMQRERDASERERLATSIVREARRLIVLVENVLFFSRSGAVEFTPNLEPLPVQALFADVVEAVQLAVDDAGQCLDVIAAPSMGVFADRRLVRQALVNLVDNALKYGGRGSHIRLVAEQRGDDLVGLCIDDDGPGIPAAERTRLFEAYERLPRDQTSERTGSGLGLAIVRLIARSCGGDAWLEEASSGGTRAVIELHAAVLPEPLPEPSGVV
jgi:signal transduction histidine kinase